MLPFLDFPFRYSLWLRANISSAASCSSKLTPGLSTTRILPNFTIYDFYAKMCSCISFAWRGQTKADFMADILCALHKSTRRQLKRTLCRTWRMRNICLTKCKQQQQQHFCQLLKYVLLAERSFNYNAVSTSNCCGNNDTVQKTFCNKANIN